jgi:hypothetical protein
MERKRTKFHVEFDIEILDMDVTPEQVKEWVEYMCGYSGVYPENINPLVKNVSFDPLFGTFIIKRV